MGSKVNAQPAAGVGAGIARLLWRADGRNEASRNRNGRGPSHIPSPRHAENVERGREAFPPAAAWMRE
jgi:hypothetical protein